jgi:hypothetical protein
VPWRQQVVALTVILMVVIVCLFKSRWRVSNCAIGCEL